MTRLTKIDYLGGLLRTYKSGNKPKQYRIFWKWWIIKEVKSVMSELFTCECGHTGTPCSPCECWSYPHCMMCERQLTVVHQMHLR